MKNLKKLAPLLAIITVFTLAGCSDETQNNTEIQATATITPTLSPEDQKLVDEYVKPTTNTQGEKIEAVDPLVELLSN